MSRRLTEREADLYRDWITNRRHLETIIAQLEEVSAVAGETPSSIKQSHHREPTQRNTDHRKVEGQNAPEKCGTSVSWAQTPVIRWPRV